MRRLVTKRRIIVGAAIALVLLQSGYIAAFFVIRANAYRDYEHLLTTGDWPAWSDMRQFGDMIPYEDGGSIGRPRFGYELIKIDRIDSSPQSPPPGALRARERGAALEFTCRGWFPLLERLMDDREEIIERDGEQ